MKAASGNEVRRPRQAPADLRFKFNRQRRRIAGDDDLSQLHPPPARHFCFLSADTPSETCL